MKLHVVLLLCLVATSCGGDSPQGSEDALPEGSAGAPPASADGIQPPTSGPKPASLNIIIMSKGPGTPECTAEVAESRFLAMRRQRVRWYIYNNEDPAKQCPGLDGSQVSVEFATAALESGNLATARGRRITARVAEDALFGIATYKIKYKDEIALDPELEIDGDCGYLCGTVPLE